MLFTIFYSYFNKKYYGKDKVLENIEYKPLYEENTQYTKFINPNKIFPKSKAISIFSGITKSHSFGKCPKCSHEIDDFSFAYFTYFID